MLALAFLAQLAITHVTVIDVANGHARSDVTVVIAQGHVVSVSNSPAPPGARVLNGAGKYVIPGLWDMHSHLQFDRYVRGVAFPQYIANGVTGLRDMDGDCDSACADQDTAYNPLHAATAAMVRQWKRDTLAPRIVAASNLLDGPHPLWPGSAAIATPEQGRAAVDTAIARGADFIKVYSGLSRASYLAIADESKRRGIPFVGHVPDSISIDDASAAGQLSIEHMYRFADVCSSRPGEIARAKGRALLIALNDAFNLEACRPIMRRLAERGTWVCPTLTVSAGVWLHQDTSVTHDSRQAMMAPADTAWWNSIRRRYAAIMTPGDVARNRSLFNHEIEMVGALYRAGVPLLIGTDVSNPWVYWGSSVHDELALFVRAGLTPLAALQAATIGPARFFHATDSLGTVAPGKVADLVVLDANPLDEIANTRRIHAVIVRGVLRDIK
ncbi:MAG TPA: amidohydrolase family protein [Gemmatimonadaceae bacterium]|nr:amidohydrolase family protein [Gemmatimonadaceae bacterium]